MKTKFVNLMDHVHRNRAKYAIAGTSAMFITLMRYNAQEVNAFLEEHDLLDKYYQMDEI